MAAEASTNVAATNAVTIDPRLIASCPYIEIGIEDADL